jgi:hypothetical protein
MKMYIYIVTVMQIIYLLVVTKSLAPSSGGETPFSIHIQLIVGI